MEADNTYLIFVNDIRRLKIKVGPVKTNGIYIIYTSGRRAKIKECVLIQKIVRKKKKVNTEEVKQI